MAIEKLGVQATLEGLGSFLSGMNKMDASIEEIGLSSKGSAKDIQSFARASLAGNEQMIAKAKELASKYDLVAQRASRLAVKAAAKGNLVRAASLDKYARSAKGLADGFKEASQAGRENIKIGDQLKQNWQAMTIAIAAVGAAIVIAKKAFDFAEAGAQLLRIERAGENLAASFGTSMDKIVAAVDRAANGTVARSDIVLASNKAMTLGVASSAEQMATLMEIAAVRAKAMGLTTTQAFSDIVTGIGRMSPMILDNLGILTGGEKTFTAYAESIGKAKDELTDVEKKQALFNKVLLETQPMLEAAKGQADDAATAYERLKVNLKNASDEQKKLIGLELAPALNQINDAIQERSNLTSDLNDLNLILIRDYGNLIVVQDEYGVRTSILKDDIEELADAESNKIDQDLELLRLAKSKIDTGEGEIKTLEEIIEKNKELAEEQEKLIQMEIDESFKRLKELMTEDLTGGFEDFITKVGELTTEIATLEAIGDPTEEQRQGLLETGEELDKVIKKWREHTAQVIFNVAQQALAIDGLTEEEVKALAKTAETLGLVDPGFVALTEKIFEDAEALELAGDQSDIFAESMETTLEVLTNATIAADDLADALNRLPTTKTIALAFMGDQVGFGMRSVGEWEGTSSVIGTSSTITNTETTEGDNLNLTINTSAPAEDIAADFRMLKAMGSRV